MLAQMGVAHALGLSPRMRGNQQQPITEPTAAGSIPAHAGEPALSCRIRKLFRVYPRACGGTVRAITQATAAEGLSPRMRGNHPEDVRQSDDLGSIPAHAGEPLLVPVDVQSSRVYPRACGGTSPPRRPTHGRPGLSPRMRGNPQFFENRGWVAGSIPAHAGEPRPPSGPPWPRRVYPRACGGTLVDKVAQNVDKGLSPRMRGNLAHYATAPADWRSIPAHAGEPRVCYRVCRVVWVYPRACGGTRMGPDNLKTSLGLSPRMRGNRRPARQSPTHMGSIPAHAGEPGPRSVKVERSRVYPRACGGTGPFRQLGGDFPGLSPRMRGNHEVAEAPVQQRGSIPAHAGEPQ